MLIHTNDRNARESWDSAGRLSVCACVVASRCLRACGRVPERVVMHVLSIAKTRGCISQRIHPAYPALHLAKHAPPFVKTAVPEAHTEPVGRVQDPAVVQCPCLVLSCMHSVGWAYTLIYIYICTYVCSVYQASYRSELPDTYTSRLPHCWHTCTRWARQGSLACIWKEREEGATQTAVRRLFHGATVIV